MSECKATLMANGYMMPIMKNPSHELWLESLPKIRYVCKCHHVVHEPDTGHMSSRIYCTWCGGWMHKD